MIIFPCPPCGHSLNAAGSRAGRRLFWSLTLAGLILGPAGATFPAGTLPDKPIQGPAAVKRGDEPSPPERPGTPKPSQPPGREAKVAAPAAGRVPAGASFTADQAGPLARLGVDQWLAAGYRGRGVKVAILDSGFRGYRDFLGKALPAHVTVRSFRPDGNLEARNSQHGILCGEVVHALAPEAEVLFANWDLEDPVSFLSAVKWARQTGARVITCSVITPDWSDGEGGGDIHQALRRLVGSGKQQGDPLFFASAGNTALRHWMGDFHAGASGFHEWQRGKEDNLLTPWGSEPVEVELYAPPKAHYDLFVHDTTTRTEVGRASTARDQRDRHYAVVRFPPVAGRTYEVQVRLAEGQPGRFHLVALSSDSLNYATPHGSICFPADGDEVITLGAVDDKGHRLSYSSCGPNSRRPKPDFVAQVPFPVHRVQPFGGTSAASPQAAGLAALWFSRHPEWAANQVHAAMKSSVRDVGPKGYDFETGFGVIGMPRP